MWEGKKENKNVAIVLLGIITELLPTAVAWLEFFVIPQTTSYQLQTEPNRIPIVLVPTPHRQTQVFFVSSAVRIGHYLNWAVCASVTFLAITAITLAVNFVFYRRELSDAVRKYRK